MSRYMILSIAAAGVFLLHALMHSTAYAQGVPGAVLYFNPVETDRRENSRQV